MTKMFPRGVEYMISLATSVLRKNLAEGTRDPMVDVKVRLPKGVDPDRLTHVHDVGVFDRIEILSPTHPHEVIATLCAHFDAPVPGSDGRGICYITTTAPLRAHKETPHAHASDDHAGCAKPA